MKLAKDALFAHMGYVPHEGQALVHASAAPRRVLACGARWGKSTCAAMEIVAALLEPREECLGWCVAPTYETAELVFGLVVRTVREHFPHRIIEHSDRDHRLVVMNLAGGRSELRGKSSDDPNGLVGAALDWVVLDEAARLAPRVWESHVSQRLLDRAGWALMVSTPRGSNWFYREWKRGQRDRDVRYASWSSPSWLNPHMSRDAIEDERRSLPPDAFAQEYAAEFVGALIDPCDVCGGPDAQACHIVVVDGDAELLRCGDCNGVVGEDGKTRVAVIGGKPVTMVLELSVTS